MSSADFVPNPSLYFSSADDFFRRALADSGGCYRRAVVIALLFILLYHFFLSRKFPLFNYASPSSSSSAASAASVSRSVNSQPGVSELVSDDDLKGLIRNLEETSDDAAETWEHVVHKSNDRVSYNAKCCRPKEGGPAKYLSVTVFEGCSPEALRDFYMDNDYRKKWDKTVIGYEQLEMNVASGIEIGRTIKKFPLLTPREYVLAWRLWEGNDNMFYCVIKECDHDMVPRQRKYVRVGYFRSCWRIRKAPGGNACEIKVFHHENAGLNVKMAKLAFSRGIWSYVCKMDNALRQYIATTSGSRLREPSLPLSAISLMRKVPAGIDEMTCAETSESDTSERVKVHEAKQKKEERKAWKKVRVSSLVVVGGAICLCRGQSALAAKVALAYFLTKLRKRPSQPTHTIGNYLIH